MKKRGQMKLSFGMIFSIILIIIFIAFAGYGITKFLNLQKTIQISKFADDFQFDVDKLWRANQGSQPVEYILPKNIIGVCFKENPSGDNMELRKNQEFGGTYSIKHLNIPEELPCIKNENGKVKMILEKEFGEALVTITEIEQ